MLFPESHTIIDPYVGAGGTLLACEIKGHECVAGEIDPAYCAVTIKRWAEMTGQDPVRIEG